MTLANDSFNRIADTSTSGTPLATHQVAAKEYPVVMVADDSGHLQQTVPTYSWWVPGSAVGASKLYADIYNSSASTSIVEIRGLWAIPKTDVANAAAVAVEVGLYRTNTIGTTGVNFTYNGGVTSTAHVITPYDTANAASTAVFGTSAVSARALPAGGAGISALWWAQYVMPEELNAGSAIAAFTNLLPVAIMSQRLTLNPGQGLLVKQGTVASTGSLAFLGQFTIV